MRMNRFLSAVLIAIVLCTSENDRSFAARNGDAAYGARLAARSATDEGFSLGRKGDFRGAKKKFSQAIERDPTFSPAYQFRAAACLQMCDWPGAIVDLDRLITLDPNDAEIFNERGYARRQLGDLNGARDDFDRCITLGTDQALPYANRAEVEAKLGDDSAAAADVAQAQSLITTMPDSPRASSRPIARKNQTHHQTSRTGTSNNPKGTTR
jgi:tetratricopeptide (TPR) repeat protein